MKLNPDCIRAILITVEDHSDFNHPTEYDADNPFDTLCSFTHEEIIYHIFQCEKSGLLDGVHYYDGGTHTDIRDLSPAGHEFLANMRNDVIWKKVISKGVGAPLSILMALAKEAAIKYFLG